jgi:hypothetical protein
MVVSGVPESKADHALRLGCFAIEMRDALMRYNKQKDLKNPLVCSLSLATIGFLLINAGLVHFW